MNKKQLIDELSRKLEQKNIRYPKWELISIIEPVLEVVMETLSRSEEVQINKFGRFFIKHKKGSRYYNMNTKQNAIAPDKKIIQFTPHRGFHFDGTGIPSEPGSDTDNKKE